MEPINFTSPLETVKIISIISYLNTLSDFLYEENFLNESNIYKPIQVVNALYNYFSDDLVNNKSEILEKKKLQLARKLIEHSDLYGTKENEKLDENFVNLLFKHIITSFVFEKYTNIYGFLAEVVRTSDNLSINNLHKQIINKLLKEKYKNEFGPDSRLEPSVVHTIFQDFILPLFPKRKKESTLIEVDYIYAQAGAVFLLSLQTPQIMKPNLQTVNETFDLEDKFDKYTSIAHVVENSVISGKADVIALRIFTLPALLFYVYKEQLKLKNEETVHIIHDPHHVSEALKQLFSYLNTVFVHIDKARDEDYRYQFYQAMSNFKNRTTLAMEIIKKECQIFNETDFEQEIVEYKNNPDDYKCKKTLKSLGDDGKEFLPDVNQVSKQFLSDLNRCYQDQVNNITEKFLVYERESIREAFGNDRIKSLTTVSVEISQGLFENYYSGGVGIDVSENQLIRESDDLFRFYFPENRRKVFYALIRKDTNVSFIQESDNGEMFRQKLGLTRYQEFRDNYFQTPIKKLAGESFEIFIDRIAEERARKFNKTLSNEGYGETSQEWWINFGLSLIPFYTCSHGIRTNDFDEVSLSCPLDIISILPLVGEIGLSLSTLTRATTKSLLSLTGTTFQTVFVRRSLKLTLALSSEFLTKQTAVVSGMLTKKVFQNFALSMFRLIDPGFELVFTVGKEGLRSFSSLIKVLGKYTKSYKGISSHYWVSLEGVRNLLKKVENTITNLRRKVGSKFKKPVYVNSLSNQESGYGYKYVVLPNKRIAQLRRVKEYKTELPVVRVLNKDKKSYMFINPLQGTRQKRLHLENPSLVEYSKYPVIRFRKNDKELKLCQNLRSKRSPNFCLRDELKLRRKESEESALSYARGFTELSEDVVESKLRNYIFPENEEKQLDFVKEWLPSAKVEKSVEPVWSHMYKIDDPELFSRLMYDKILDEHAISSNDALERIQRIYPKNGESLFNPLKDLKYYTNCYTKDLINEFVTFEDYVAIRNYMCDGYKRIGKDTTEAKYMREALYRLAIRQSNDPNWEHKLFRGESRSPDVLKKLFLSNNEELVLERFTSTTLNEEIADRFQRHRNILGTIPVLHEMTFLKPYLRAKVVKIYRSYEEEIVLLPGSKFHIESVKVVPFKGIKALKVKLSFMHEAIPKHKWYKNIMDELEKMKKNGAKPYETDPRFSSISKSEFFSLFENSKFGLQD